MPPVALRPRSRTEIIDAAVQLLRRHYGELVTVTALFMIPVIIARVFLVSQDTITPAQLTELATGSATTNSGFIASTGILGLAVWGVLSFVMSSMSTAAVVVIVSDSYLGREVTTGAAINQVLGRIWTILGAVLLQGLLIGIGFLLFFIPGVIFSCWFFATTTVVMVEGKDAVAALRRSRELARGSVGEIFSTLGLALFIVWLVDLLVNVIVVALIVRLRSGVFAASFAPYIISIFIVPFVNVVITLLYYDLRIRKEGFDLELMAKELGLGAPIPTKA
jgi:hypothetical protein